MKYGTEKYVNCSKLNSVNLCFDTTLNKYVEPSYLYEAMSDPNWVEVRDNEIEALNRNNTLTICDLPIGRKTIESKWIWKIKYKASALRWHLEEIRMTWGHLGKKRTRLQLYTKVDEEKPYIGWRRRRDSLRRHQDVKATTSKNLRRCQNITDLKKP
nr:ribonuclease H-like domain-containing protein [Tanacetum cinerariifolium]